MLDPIAIRAGLDANALLPNTIRCYDQVGSTMDLAREAIATLPPAALPVLIVAEEQTKGRGRQGRRWIAPAGSAILFSLGLRPPPAVNNLPTTLVWLAAVSLLETITGTTPLQAVIKWPNDVLVNTPTGWSKVAGILLEGGWDGSTLVWAIIGCGINVSATPDPATTRYPATSLLEAGTPRLERLHFLQALLRRYNHWFHRLNQGDTETLWQTWRRHLITLGQPVTITTAGGVVSGEAIDVDRTGTLLVRETNGVLRSIESGDVGLIGGAHGS